MGEAVRGHTLTSLALVMVIVSAGHYLYMTDFSQLVYRESLCQFGFFLYSDC
jgi:hypothetical protein